MDLPDLPKSEVQIIEETNAFRRNHGLEALAQNPALRTAAQAFARYLAMSGSFSHEADGRKPAERALAAGYRYCIVAENLALNQRSDGFTTNQLATEALQGWMASPSHRAAMLHAHVTDIGVGIARAPDRAPKFISVQMFGRPDSLRYAFVVRNESKSEVSYLIDSARHRAPAASQVTHTTCVPTAVTFELKWGQPGLTFDAGPGHRYMIAADGDGKLKVQPSIEGTVQSDRR